MRLFDFKHEIAPIGYKIFEDHLILSGQFMRLYLVMKLPSEYSFGLLNAIGSSEAIFRYGEITYTSKLMRKSMSKAITKERHNIQRKIDRSKDDRNRAELQKELEELETEIYDLARSNNKTVDVTMILKVKGDTLEALNDHCEQIILVMEQFGFKLMLLRDMQEELLRLSTPLWMSDYIDETLHYDFGIPLSTMSAAAFWPYHYEEVRDKGGVLLGIELYRRGLIQINPFLWLDEPNKAVPLGINSGNWMFLGAIGSGKTTAAYKFIQYYIRNQIKLLWIDPETTNKQIIRKYHGEYIEFGLPGNFINVLDLRPISVDEDSDIDNYRYNTTLAKNAAIRDLKEIIKVYHNNDPVACAAVDVLDDVVLKTYEEKSITAKSFEGYSYSDYPILSDVMNTLNQKIEQQSALGINNDKKLEQLTNLQVKLTPMIKADGQFFDGHTNISFALDDNQKLLGIGTRILDSAGERIRNSIFYLIMRYAEGVIFARSQYSAAVFEEAHRFINLPYCLERMENMWLRDRKYHSTCGLIMQEVSPFVRNGSYDGKAIVDFSRSIFNNTVYKTFMRLDRPAVDDLSSGKLINLNENEEDAILNYTQGQGLLLRGKDKYSIQVVAHGNELKDLELNS